MAQKFIVPITIKQLASAGSDALTVFVNDESYGRVKLEAGGRISWSDGTGTHDTNLYRDSANVLATDDVFKAVSGVITMAVNGVPTASLPNGALAVDILNNAFYFRSNSTWTQVTGGGGGASLTVGDTAPVAPDVGDLWFESDTGKTFVYYDSHWVEIGGAGPQGPEGPQGPAGPTGPIGTQSDVTITSVALNDVIAWNGSAWVNNSALLAAKAPLASPTFTGTVTVPTPVSNTDASTKAYVDSTASTTATNAATALTNHEADTTSIHGIADTSILVTTTGSQTLTNKTITSPLGLVKGDVGLGNADNTSDANKPVSTAGQTALDLKAPLASPTFTGTVTIPSGASISGFAPLASPALTGTPTAPTAAALTNTTQIATTAFVATAVSGAAITALDDVGDVAITSAASGDLLKWNGSTWVNAAGYALLASPTFTGTATTNNLTVSGNLVVSGTSTSVNTETVTVDDNIIILNNNVTASPTENAGIEVERGTSANVLIRWNETNDKWEFTNDGSAYSNLGAGGATISDTAPASPTAGQIWFQSTNGKTFVYYDSQWIEVGGVGTGARMVSSSSAPASPLEGSMWFDTDTAQTFVYYDSSWIEIGASGVTASVQDSAPASPVSGQIWFNSLTGGTYVYYGTNWIEVGASPFSALVNTINAKGDLLVGTADNTLGGLTAGSANQVLTVDSSTATGLKWSTPTVYQAVVANVSDTEIGYLDGVTSAIQTQIDTKAPLASPTFTGAPLAPTAAANTNTTQLATTAFVTSAVSSLDNIGDVTISQSYAIGATGPAGGKIFITPSTAGNSTGKYFEAAPFVSSDVTRSWVTNINSNQSTAVSGADGAAIGTGAQNTIDIVAQAGNVAGSCAAAYASDYTYGGFSDWFLPSRNELAELYTNKASIGGYSTAGNGGYYWSSSEASASQAYHKHMDNGTDNAEYKYDQYNYVRPVRSFTAGSSATSGDVLKWNGTAWVNDNTTASTGKAIAMAIVFGG